MKNDGFYDRWPGLFNILCAQFPTICNRCYFGAQWSQFLLSPWSTFSAILSHTWSSPREESFIRVQSLCETPSQLQDLNKVIHCISLSQWRKNWLDQLQNSWKASSFCARIKAGNMPFHHSCPREKIEVLFKPKSILDIESHDSEDVALDYNWPRLNGAKDVAIWKENQGSSKSWRICATVKHNSKAFDISSLKTKNGNLVCPWVQASTSAPVAYLKARKNFRQYQRLKQNSPQQEQKTWRRHRYSFIRFCLKYVSTGSYQLDVNFSLILSWYPSITNFKE